MEMADIRARQALDSRGNPTIAAEGGWRDGQVARASVPSGPSSGRKEALEVRDGDPERFGGAGVLRDTFPPATSSEAA